MSGISIKIENQLKDRLAKFAEKNNVSVSETIRRLVEEGLAVAEYKDKNETTGENNQKLAVANSIPANQFKEQQKLEAEYKKHFEFMMLEVASLLHLIVADSGKFSPEEAKRLLNTAHIQVKTYMQYYESGGVVKKESNDNICGKNDV